MRTISAVVVAALATLSLRAATLDVKVATPGGVAIEDAVVYAIPSHPIPVGRKVATMDQIDRMFVPHILPVQTGTWIEFPNSDNIRHQVYSVSPARRFQLPLYVGKPAAPIQFPSAGVVSIGCNIHEQMSAYIVVVDTPFFATATHGKATLRDLPADQYSLRVWYEGMKDEPKAQSVTLGADDHPAVSIVASGK